jgi:DNA-binding NarL/FixJ family response regulator
MENILIADRYQIIRLGISTLIQQLLPNSRVVVAETLEEITTRLATARYDLLIMELDIDGYQDDTHICNLLALQPGLQVMIYTNDQNKFIKISHLIGMLVGYLSKEASIEELSTAIVNISKGTKYFQNMDRIGGSNLVKSNVGNKTIKVNEMLSLREQEVAQHLVDGINTSEIASLLGVNRTTISTYKKRIFNKIGIDSLADLVHVFLTSPKS